MWVFTTDGFFSIVHNKYCAEEELTVRARSETDLEKFMASCGCQVEIMEIGHASYRYRIQVPRETVARYLSRYVMELPYGNFKDACFYASFSMNRMDVLHAIWEECRESWKDSWHP
jgi:hypothetical protein